MNLSISLDWWQAHYKCTPHLQGSDFGRFMLRNVGRRATFQNTYAVHESYLNAEGEKTAGEIVAWVNADPDKGFLKPDACFMKIENKFLYQDKLPELIFELETSLQLTFKNVSRVDIACDFHTFKNNLDPETFIGRFVSINAPYVKLRKTKATLYFEHNETNEYRYLRLGTAKSNMNYYLYNKTVELNQVKNKPWIREKWKKDGLDDTKDIWRLEFAIHSCSKGLIDPAAAEEIKKFRSAKNFLKSLEGKKLSDDPDDPTPALIVEAEETIKIYNDNKEEVLADAKYFTTHDVLTNFNEIYRGLFHHYFDFRYKDAQVKKCRMKKIPLLDLAKPDKVVMQLVEKMESNRTDKIILKGLMFLNNENRRLNVAHSHHSDKSMDAFEVEKYNSVSQDIVNRYANSRDLVEWVKNKFPEEYEKMGWGKPVAKEKTDFSDIAESEASKKAKRKKKNDLFDGEAPF